MFCIPAKATQCSSIMVGRLKIKFSFKIIKAHFIEPFFLSVTLWEDSVLFVSSRGLLFGRD